MERTYIPLWGIRLALPRGNASRAIFYSVAVRGFFAAIMTFAPPVK
jgi:hypothetical protein